MNCSSSVKINHNKRLYYICLITDDTYIIEIMITVTVNNKSITNYYNYYTFSGKIFKQGTNTPWPFTDMIVYMSPGDMFNATCGCKGHQIPSYWKAFDKDGVEVDTSTHIPNVCNTGTNTCNDIFQTITEPLIVLCSTIDFHDSTMHYSRPVVINIQGII